MQLAPCRRSFVVRPLRYLQICEVEFLPVLQLHMHGPATGALVEKVLRFEFAAAVWTVAQRRHVLDFERGALGHGALGHDVKGEFQRIRHYARQRTHAHYDAMNLLRVLGLGVLHSDFHGALHDGYFVHLLFVPFQHLIIYRNESPGPLLLLMQHFPCN
jgi:hypothetical protein